MPLDPDLLDPSKDIPDYLQATFEKMAEQDGGRNNRVQQYRNYATQGIGPGDVMAMSYDEQMKRDAEKVAAMAPQQTDIRSDPRFFADGHLVGANPNTLPNPAPQFDESGGYDTRGENTLPMPAGQPQPKDTAIGATTIDPAQIDLSKLQAVQDQISALLSKPQKEYTPSPMPAPDSASAALTALAMLFAPANQSGNILLALRHNQDAIRQRNDVLAQIHAKTTSAQERQQLEALLKQAALEESRAYHQASLDNAARIASVKEAGLNQRATIRAGSQMDQLQKKIAAKNNQEAEDIRSEFEGRKKILQSVHPDWTPDAIDEKAAEYVNAKPELAIAQTALAGSRKLTEDTLRPLKQANLRSLTEYRNALKDYLPDRIAAQFAGVLLADERLQQQFLMFQQGLDEKGWEMGVKEAQSALDDAQKSYDDMTKEAAKDSSKRASDLADARANLNAIAPLVLDGNGQIKQGTAPADEQDYRYWAGKVSELSKGDGGNTDEALRQAKASVEFAKERLKEIKGQRPEFKVGAPIGGKGLLDKARGMLGGGKGKSAGLTFDGNAKNDAEIVNPQLKSEIGDIAMGLGFTVGVTTAKTGHRFLTTSGNRSRHMDGNGVDITTINGEPVTTKKGMKMADQFVAALEQAGYARNTESGHDRAVLWKTNVGGNHFNHIHVSNRVRAAMDDANPFLEGIA